MLESCLVAAQLAAPEEGLNSMKLVNTVQFPTIGSNQSIFTIYEFAK
jgi:hypothetical protein